MIRPLKLPPYQRRKELTNKTASTMSINATTLHLPAGTVPLEHQVAGHTFQLGTNDIGMLKDQRDGSVLKSTAKPICGKREIEFYEQVQTSTDPNIMLLKELLPVYYGCVQMKIGERTIDFIRLSDITHGMSEPCIMDVKIGRRTWDPLATQDKINLEEKKYQACKQNLGLCIPGFQVYSLANGRIKRYGKEYGKQLNEITIKDALKIFLNAENGVLCRPLLMQLLSGLWSIQKWARTQKTMRIYSSSLLLAYDARRLRNSIQTNKKSSHSLSSLNGSLTPTSQSVSPSSAKTNSNNSGSDQFSWAVQPPQTEKIEQVYQKVQRCHSTENNYDEDLKAIRENYTFMLDNLIDDYRNTEWAYVKMIDFAHVFAASSDDENSTTSVDENYLFGVENLVKLFEQFLKECD